MHFGVFWCKLVMVRKVRLSIALDFEDYQYVKELARSKGLSLCAVIRLGMKEWIKQRKTQKQA
jgi:ABC-type sulfate transport system permease subunit